MGNDFPMKVHRHFILLWKLILLKRLILKKFIGTDFTMKVHVISLWKCIVNGFTIQMHCKCFYDRNDFIMENA